MRIDRVSQGKKYFLPLLLLGDEQESMIDTYLDRGELFTLYDKGLKTICVVTEEEEGVCEIKNIATDPASQGQGYGKRMLAHVAKHYAARCHTMLVGTGDSPRHLAFYAACGFEISHREKDFFTRNYDHPIVEDGVVMRDMVYLKKSLKK